MPSDARDSTFAPARIPSAWLALALIFGATWGMQWVYVLFADFSWAWRQSHPGMTDERLADIFAGKDAAWFFLKHFFWWNVLLVLEVVFLVTAAVLMVLLLWPDRLKGAVSAAARAVLWGKGCLAFNALAGVAMVMAMPRPVQRMPSQVDPFSWASLLQMSEKQASIMLGQAQGPVVLASVAVMVWLLVSSRVMRASQAVLVATLSYGSWALLMAWGGPKLIMLFIA